MTLSPILYSLMAIENNSDFIHRLTCLKFSCPTINVRLENLSPNSISCITPITLLKTTCLSFLLKSPISKFTKITKKPLHFCKGFSTNKDLLLVEKKAIARLPTIKDLNQYLLGIPNCFKPIQLIVVFKFALVNLA